MDERVHGGQQLALFNTHAGGHCFQPIHIFEGNSGKPILSLLRPGKRPSGEEAARVLWHVIADIMAFITKRNAKPAPLRWTKSADDILASIERYCQRTLAV